MERGYRSMTFKSCTKDRVQSKSVKYSEFLTNTPKNLMCFVLIRLYVKPSVDDLPLLSAVRNRCMTWYFGVRKEICLATSSFSFECCDSKTAITNGEKYCGSRLMDEVDLSRY